MNPDLLIGAAWRAFIRARLYRLFPLLVVLLAAGLRFHRVEAQSFWNDEGNTLRLIERSVPDLIAASALDIHPPGYYLLLKVWYLLLGGGGLVGEFSTEFALRVFSALAGTLTVACTYALGRTLFAPGVGVLAALLVAVNAFSVYYGQEARMYALLQLAAAASMLAFVAWLSYTSRTKSVSHWRDGLALALALINASGLYIHYAFPAVMLTQGVMFVLWLVGQARSSVLQGRAVRVLISYIALNLVTLAAFSPQLAPALRQIAGWPSTGGPTPPGEALATLARWLIYGSTFGAPGEAVGWWVYVWPALFMLAGLLPDWLKREAVPSWWRRTLPLAWIALTLSLFFSRGLFREANLKFLLPVELAVALLMARGLWLVWEIGAPNPLVPLEALPRLAALVGAAAILGFAADALGNLYGDPRYFRDDYRAMARAIAGDERPGDAIILNAPNQQEVFTHYYRGPTPIYTLPRGLGGDDAATAAETGQIARQYRRIFVLYWGDAERDPNRAVEKALAQNAFEVSAGWYGNVRFVRYATLSDSESPFSTNIPVNTRFGDSILLQSAILSRTVLRAGDVLGVTLTWRTQAQLSRRYRVTVQLLDSAGRLVAQRDAEPGNNMALTTTWVPGQPVVDTHGLLIPLNTLPGTYRLIVALYNVEGAPDRLLVGERDYAEIAALRVE